MRTLIVTLVFLTLLLPGSALARPHGGNCSGRPVMLAPGHGFGYPSGGSRGCSSRPVCSRPVYSGPIYYPVYNNYPVYGGFGYGYGSGWYNNNPSPRYYNNPRPVVREVEVEEVEPAEGEDKPVLTLPDIR